MTTREWNATSYHRVSNPQFAWGMAVLARLVLRGDERVIDAGCGSGRLTSELLARLPRGRVVAVADVEVERAECGQVARQPPGDVGGRRLGAEEARAHVVLDADDVEAALAEVAHRL